MRYRVSPRVFGLVSVVIIIFRVCNRCDDFDVGYPNVGVIVVESEFAAARQLRKDMKCDGFESDDLRNRPVAKCDDCRFGRFELGF